MARSSTVARTPTPPAPLAGIALDELAKFFRGLGDPTRIRLVELLLENERCVGELVDAVEGKQGRISNHLACLRWCGYVSSERVGQRVIYRIADPRVRDLVRVAREVVSDNAEAIASCTRIPAGA